MRPPHGRVVPQAQQPFPHVFSPSLVPARGIQAPFPDSPHDVALVAITRPSSDGHGRGEGSECGSSDFTMKVNLRHSAVFLHFVCLVSFLLIFIPVPSMAAARQIWPQSRPSLSEYDLTNKPMCPNSCHKYPADPVCGNDRETYRNECQLRYHRHCLGRSQLKVYYKGKCKKSRRHRRRTCIRKRRELLDKYDSYPQRPDESMSYIPVCREDGTFKKIQCNSIQNICFCVDRKTGIQKPNTISRYPVKPKCVGGTRKKGRVDKCNPKLRKQFNDNLIHQFKIEFDRVVHRRKRQRVNAQVKRNTARYPVGMLIRGEQGYTLNSTELRVVEWKFSELDLDHDNTLSFRELRSLRKVVRRVVRPRACARRFAKRCDANKNRRIERAEWSICMGINAASLISDYVDQKIKPTDQRSPPASIMRLVTRRKEVKPFHRPQECLKARREAQLKNAEKTGTKVLVPQCSPQGTYKRQQCHHIDNGEKLCFCMDPTTGEVLKGEGDCRHIKPVRQFKGCPNNRKKRFLTELMDKMVEETKNRWGSTRGPRMPAKTSLVERALRWKFYLLDVNGNGRLDKKEMRKFKNEIKQNIQKGKPQVARELRKCARNFVRYCDSNGDRIIELRELIQCTDIKKKRSSSRSSAMGFLSLKTS